MRSATRSSLIMSTSVVALDVLGVAAVGEAVGVEVRLALQLRDAQRDLVGVAQLLVGVLQELRGHRPGVEALGHVVVPLVAQHADDLGGQRLVEHLDHPLAVGAVGVGDRALLDLLPGPLAEGLDVGEEVAHGPTDAYPRRPEPSPTSGR